jgi:hypothetical protein
MDAVLCTRWGRRPGDESHRAAFLSPFVQGDEEILSRYWCAICEVWTGESYDDSFMGESTATARGPIPKEQGDADVALARTCPRPDDKWCSCEAHRRMGRRL